MSLTVELYDRPEKTDAPWTICTLDETIDIRLTWRCPSAQLLDPRNHTDADKFDPIGRLRYDPPYVAQAADGELPSRINLRLKYRADKPEGHGPVQEQGELEQRQRSSEAVEAVKNAGKPEDDGVKPADAGKSVEPMDGDKPTNKPDTSKAAVKHSAKPDDLELDGIEIWTGMGSIRAPKFWPMAIRVTVDGPGRDSQPVTIRLVPRLSVIVSGLLMVISLLLLPLFGAFTLQTLSLTLDETIMGVSGMALMSLTLGIARAIGKRSWPDALPFLGIPYLLPRALAAVAAGAVSVLLLLEYATVSIHNGTTREVKISLPARESDQLLPDTTLTYARKRANVEKALSQSLGDEICIQDVWEEVDMAACDKATNEIAVRWWQRYLAPPILQLSCKKRHWSGTSYRQLFKLDGKLIKRPEDSEPGESVQLETTADCKLGGDLIGEFHIQAKEGEESSLEGTYVASYPWTFEHGWEGDLAVLGVDGAPTDTVLNIIGERQQGAEASEPDAAAEASSEADDTATGQLLETHIRVARETDWSAGVLVPVEYKTKYLRIEIGGSRGSMGSTLGCQAESPKADTHFRAVHLPVLGDREGVERVEASSGQAGGWTSDWQGNSSSRTQAWLCTVVAGQWSPVEERLHDFAVDELVLTIDPNHLERRVRLEVPRAWMTNRIQIRTPDDRRLGTLTCSETKATNADVFAIGTLRNDGWPRSREVAGLEFEHGLVSDWSAAEGESSRWTWACWQGDDTDEVEVEARVGAEIHSGHANLETGTLEVDSPELKRCWLAADGSFGMGSPPRRYGECKRANKSLRREILEPRGVPCDYVELCTVTGDTNE